MLDSSAVQLSLQGRFVTPDCLKEHPSCTFFQIGAHVNSSTLFVSAAESWREVSICSVLKMTAKNSPHESSLLPRSDGFEKNKTKNSDIIHIWSKKEICSMLLSWGLVFSKALMSITLKNFCQLSPSYLAAFLSATFFV